MNDNHEELVQAYLRYFKASEWWERNHSVRAYAAVQKELRAIMKIAKKRNTEIRLKKKQVDQNKRDKRLKRTN